MRGKQAPKRKIIADIKYDNMQVAKFINYLMERGKKSVAQGIVYKALAEIEKREKTDPLEVFDQAMKNVGPRLEIRGRRVGGANYQIPFPVKPNRRFYLASKWVIEAANARKGKAMHKKLADEFLDAFNNQGASVKKRADVHRMAEANKAFAHFARFG